VPDGVPHVMVEAWGGGGGGYLRTVIAVTPGEALGIVTGNGGAPRTAGTASAVMRGTSAVVSAGAGAGASTTGGAGGLVVSAGGIVRNGNPGGDGSVDFMCQFGPGNPPTTPPGNGGAAIQGSVGTVGGGSAGGQGAGFVNGLVPQPGAPGEVILTW